MGSWAPDCFQTFFWFPTTARVHYAHLDRHMYRPGTAFTWDWWYTNLSTAVLSAASTTLVLNAVTPFTLAAAVDAGKKPRIQLVGATPVPQVVRVLSYVDNSPAPGQATLTVDTAISGTPTEMYQAGAGAGRHHGDADPVGAVRA